jgi:hypothetical protein
VVMVVAPCHAARLPRPSHSGFVGGRLPCSAKVLLGRATSRPRPSAEIAPHKKGLEAGAGKRRRNRSERAAVWLAPFGTTASELGSQPKPRRGAALAVLGQSHASRAAASLSVGPRSGSQPHRLGGDSDWSKKAKAPSFLRRPAMQRWASDDIAPAPLPRPSNRGTSSRCEASAIGRGASTTFGLQVRTSRAIVQIARFGRAAVSRFL